jgi:hypothetical protein
MATYTQPTNSFRDSNAASYYQGVSLVDNNITAFQRTYDRRTALLAYIKQGRAGLMRVLLNYAKSKGAYVANDTTTTWGIEYERLPRIYMSAASTTSGAANLNDILKVGSDGARLQPGDVCALVGCYVPTTRAISTTVSTTQAKATPVPELVKVLQVVQTTDATSPYNVYVTRNFAGTGYGASASNATTTSMFLWKGNLTQAEGLDDAQIYSDTNDWDYNYCEIVQAKWGATETEQNVDRFYYNNETPFQRNARRTLGEFFDGLEVKALFGSRRSEKTADGRNKWYTGGLMEFVPANNYYDIDESYFSSQKFNKLMKDKFYYGSQTKIMVCGEDFYTGISNMIDNKIILPAEKNAWGVELTRFRPTNGGNIVLVPSDGLSLNGFGKYGIMFDPDTFQYGHLKNMDIRQITINNQNPHEMTGEIYGQITFRRTNPDANHVFIMS